MVKTKRKCYCNCGSLDTYIAEYWVLLAMEETDNKKGGVVNSPNYRISIKSIANKLLPSRACVLFNFTAVIY
jgi:hypothetical protein